MVVNDFMQSSRILLVVFFIEYTSKSLHSIEKENSDAFLFRRRKGVSVGLRNCAKKLVNEYCRATLQS